VGKGRFRYWDCFDDVQVSDTFCGLFYDMGVSNADSEIRGSVAPAIAIAFYQADTIARIYSNLGYLIPILTVLCLPIMPRAKYLQTLILNTIGICIGSVCLHSHFSVSLANNLKQVRSTFGDLVSNTSKTSHPTTRNTINRNNL
jgi:hypothetical protein